MIKYGVREKVKPFFKSYHIFLLRSVFFGQAIYSDKGSSAITWEIPVESQGKNHLPYIRGSSKHSRLWEEHQYLDPRLVFLADKDFKEPG